MLEGEISQIQLLERFVELWRERFTGAIRFESDGIIKIIYFKGGDILSASTNDRADSIDEILMRAGKVSREHVKQALAKRKENETLGDALLNLGFITRKELTWARRVQVVGVIRSINAWETGSFTIVADYLPKRDEGTLFPLPQILIELLVTDPDRQKFERLLDGGEAIYAKTPEFDDQFRRLGLNEDADAIAAAIDGATSAAGVAEASGRDPFNVYRLLHALATLQLLQRVEEVRVAPASVEEISGVGVADASDMWEEHPPAYQPDAEYPSGSGFQTEPEFQTEAEPQVIEPVAPKFSFDEVEAARHPTLQVAIDTSLLPADPGGADDGPAPPARSAWDEPDEEPVEDFAAAEPEPATPKMPAWDVPPRQPEGVPMPAAVEPAAEADEEQWGFDEAQIETARRGAAGAAVAAAAAAPARAAKPSRSASGGGGRRRGLTVALLSILIIGIAGYALYYFWQSRQQAGEEPVATTPVATASSPAATDTAAAPVPAPTETAATVTIATATSAPPPSAPATPAAVPSPAVAPPAAAAGGDDARARFDAIARQYLASATGNFTVQVQILCDTGNLSNLVRDGGEDVWFVPQPIGGRSCYRVLWGRYDTREDAQRALAGIPAGLRDQNAAVKPVPKP